MNKQYFKIILKLLCVVLLIGFVQTQNIHLSTMFYEEHILDCDKSNYNSNPEQVIALFINDPDNTTDINDLSCTFTLPPIVELYSEIKLPNGEFASWHKVVPEVDYKKTARGRRNTIFSWDPLEFKILPGKSGWFIFHIKPILFGEGKIIAEFSWTDNKGENKSKIFESGLIKVTGVECEESIDERTSISIDGGIYLSQDYDPGKGFNIGFKKNGIIFKNGLRRNGDLKIPLNIGLKFGLSTLDSVSAELNDLKNTWGMIYLEHPIIYPSKYRYVSIKIGAGFVSQKYGGKTNNYNILPQIGLCGVWDINEKIDLFVDYSIIQIMGKKSFLEWDESNQGDYNNNGIDELLTILEYDPNRIFHSIAVGINFYLKSE